MEVGDELGGTVVILARDDWDQGSNGDKRSDSQYILKIEWIETAEGFGCERKRELKMTDFWPEQLAGQSIYVANH